MSKVAFITGAAQGIGKAIALRLAKDGFDIALNDIPAKEKELNAVQRQIIEASKLEALICLGDVSVEADVISMVQLTVQRFGSLDVMIANAGIVIIKPFTETTQEEFRRTLSINVDGVFFCYKHAVIQMIKQGNGGRIVGASSLAGKQGWKNLAGYSASKFAVRGLTQSAALELAEYNITVNAYAPGGVTTDMLKEARTVIANAIAEGKPGYEKLRDGESTNRQGSYVRYSSPEEIAGLVSYLVSAEAAMITGQSVSINGGMYFD